MHAMSGCDSVSSFSHAGKKAAFQTLKNKISELTNMIDFDEFPSLSLESPSVVTSINYVCYLYEGKKSVSNVNELRYRMFTKKNLSGDCLPLALHALVLHLHRANYQTFTWRLACLPVLNLLLNIPRKCRVIENGKMSTELMLSSSVLNAIIELIRCKCKKVSKINSCYFKRANLVCTDFCCCNDYEECDNKSL